MGKRRREWVDRAGAAAILAIMLFASAMAGVVVVNQAVALPAAIGAARGHGVAGAAMATIRNCSSGPSGSCAYRGDFRSNDGTIRLQDVGLKGGGWPVDAPAAAVYQGRSLFGPLVFRAHSVRPAVYEALVLFGGLMMAGLGGWACTGMAVSALRERRLRRLNQAPAA